MRAQRFDRSSTGFGKLLEIVVSIVLSRTLRMLNLPVELYWKIDTKTHMLRERLVGCAAVPLWQVYYTAVDAMLRATRVYCTQVAEPIDFEGSTTRYNYAEELNMVGLRRKWMDMAVDHTKVVVEEQSSGVGLTQDEETGCSGG